MIGNNQVRKNYLVECNLFCLVSKWSIWMDDPSGEESDTMKYLAEEFDQEQNLISNINDSENFIWIWIILSPMSILHRSSKDKNWRINQWLSFCFHRWIDHLNRRVSMLNGMINGIKWIQWSNISIIYRLKIFFIFTWRMLIIHSIPGINTSLIHVSYSKKNPGIFRENLFIWICLDGREWIRKRSIFNDSNENKSIGNGWTTQWNKDILSSRRKSIDVRELNWWKIWSIRGRSMGNKWDENLSEWNDQNLWIFFDSNFSFLFKHRDNSLLRTISIHSH